MRQPGVEPGSTAWKAAMLTVIPLTPNWMKSNQHLVTLKASQHVHRTMIVYFFSLFFLPSIVDRQLVSSIVGRTSYRTCSNTKVIGRFVSVRQLIQIMLVINFFDGHYLYVKEHGKVIKHFNVPGNKNKH